MGRDPGSLSLTSDPTPTCPWGLLGQPHPLLIPRSLTNAGSALVRSAVPVCLAHTRSVRGLSTHPLPFGKAGLGSYILPAAFADCTFLRMGPLWGLTGADFTLELCPRVNLCVTLGKSFPPSDPRCLHPQKGGCRIAMSRGLNEILQAERPCTLRHVVGAQ